MRYFFLLMATMLIASPIALAQEVPPTPSDSDPKAAPTTEDPATETDGEEQADAAPDDTEATDDPESEEAEEKESSSWLNDMFSSGAMGYMSDGGIFMWPILLLGILAMGVAIERYRSLQLLSTDTTLLRSQVADLLEADRVEDAMKVCDTEKGPVPAVLSAGLRKYFVLRRLNRDQGSIEEQVVKSMDDYGVHVVAALERHLPVLATISSVAPMLGFLGTVAGMIVAFKNIEENMGVGDQNIVQLAAAGISVALLTTCFGLIVGIPTFMAYNYFTGIVNRAVLEMEESSSELIEGVTLKLSLGAGNNQPAKPTNPMSELKQEAS